MARHGDEQLRRAAARELARPHLQPVPGSILPEAAIHDGAGIASPEAGDEQPNEPVHSTLSRADEDLDRALDELADRLIARQREEREERETRENAAMHTDAGGFTDFRPLEIETPAWRRLPH